MFWLTVFVLAIATKVQSQATSQSSVAPELRECYANPKLVDRNNLPPMTIQVLIDIIQQIEDNPDVNMDLRQLVVLLLQSYRQDGIQFHQSENNMASSRILPFAPTFHSFHRTSIVQSRIIQRNLPALDNTIVNSILKCTLHHMFSTTVDARLRGDENECHQLPQYRALRIGRDLTQHLLKDDVEILDLAHMKSSDKHGQMKQYHPDDDVEYNNLNGVKSERQLQGESPCPLLGGVVDTRWGAVSAGHLLSGIAGGAQLQRISVADLVKGFGFSDGDAQHVTSTYPTTFSGDLAEAVLIQVPQGRPSVSVGTGGRWNTTQAPRFFAINRRINIEMTDPEILGDVDGFVLGAIVNSALESSSSLKLSQLLDMYYNERNGVINPTRRACNRRDLIGEFITTINFSTLLSEVKAFTAVLKSHMLLPGTITEDLDLPIQSALNNFQTYITTTLNTINCAVTRVTSNDYRLRTNLYLVVDSSWPYRTIYPVISYLLDSIEVGKYGSSITLLSAFDGSIVLNTTFSLAEFHSTYTQERHNLLTGGVNLESTLRNVRKSMHTQLEFEMLSNYVGGNSTVLLFLINSPVTNNQATWEEATILNETVPDLRILFATSTNQLDNLWNLVRDMHNDISTISLPSNNVDIQVPLYLALKGIQNVARRVINPVCGSIYKDVPSGTRQLDDYLEPGYINFYSIAPNYFFQHKDNRKIRITRSGGGAGNFIICHSRVTSQPRQNSSLTITDPNALTCETLTTGTLEIKIEQPCAGYWTINSCPFFYFSVQSVVPSTVTTYSAVCSGNACRFPYSIRYQVQIEEFGCYSSGVNVGVSLGLIVVTILFNLL